MRFSSQLLHETDLMRRREEQGGGAAAARVSGIFVTTGECHLISVSARTLLLLWVISAQTAAEEESGAGSDLTGRRPQE